MADLLQKHPMEMKNLGMLEDFQVISEHFLGNSGQETYFEVLAKNYKLVDARVWGVANDVPWDFAFFQSTNYDVFNGELERVMTQWNDQSKKVHPQDDHAGVTH